MSTMTTKAYDGRTDDMWVWDDGMECYVSCEECGSMVARAYKWIVPGERVYACSRACVTAIEDGWADEYGPDGSRCPNCNGLRAEPSLVNGCEHGNENDTPPQPATSPRTGES